MTNGIARIVEGLVMASGLPLAADELAVLVALYPEHREALDRLEQSLGPTASSPPCP